MQVRGSLRRGAGREPRQIDGGATCLAYAGTLMSMDLDLILRMGTTYLQPLVTVRDFGFEPQFLDFRRTRSCSSRSSVPIVFSQRESSVISKFIAIRNIGKFASCNASGDVTFRRLTLILGENGKGKTTLGDILRSLSTGKPDYILGRKTLGSATAPFAQVLLDGNNIVTFKDGKWDAPGLRVAIYDSTFVDENVHSGNHIDHGHRKNLYGVIVGEEGVVLAKKVDEYDASIRELNKDIASKANVVRALLPAGFTLETFLALTPDADIDAKIADKQSEIATLGRAKEIKEKDSLTGISLPQLPQNFEALLAKLLDDISKEAESRVKQHLGTHARPGGEQWIAQGLPLANGQQCPFCGQEVSGLDLMSAYQKYFGATYAAFKKELASLQESVDNAFGEAALLIMQKTLTDNAALVAFWSDFVTPAIPELAFADIRTALEALRSAATSRLQAKVESPLESIPANAGFELAGEVYRGIGETAAAYNNALAEANKLIAAKKKDTAAGDLVKARSELSGLQAVKKRFETAVAEACDEYQKRLVLKNELDGKKASAKFALDEYCKKVFNKYEKRINQLLDIFGAGFRISDAKTSYAGGNVSSSFRIVINNVAVELGDPDTPLVQACFRNTLSAGDRSTLALTFFIAQLENDPKLADTIVLFDDPFTSQDKSRRLRTQHQIGKLAAACRQVIVLSHDASFLTQIRDWKSSGEVKTLQFFRTGGADSRIVECDFDELLRGDYFDNYNVLYKFLHENEGTPRQVVRSIRPLLEGYLRFKQPKEFKADEWLGDMIQKIREAPGGSPLHDAQPLLEDLEPINEYSKAYHHAEGEETEGDPIDDTELQTFIKRTFALVGGF